MLGSKRLQLEQLKTRGLFSSSESVEGTDTSALASGVRAGVRHYRFALTQIFDVLKYDAAVVLEEDLSLSPDFLAYMVTEDPFGRTQCSYTKPEKRAQMTH